MSDLFERVWPVDDAKGAVVIVHGMAEHSGRYDYVARALNAAGYAVHAPDLRGHGQSPGFPGDMGGDVRRIVDDIAELCTRVHHQHTKTFLLGHSMGTLFCLPAALEVRDGLLSGLVLSGIAIEPGTAILEQLGKPEPALPPELISRSPEIVQAYIDDPLVIKTVPPGVALMAVEAIPRAKAAVTELDMPVLMMHGTADQLCSIGGAHEAYAQIILSDKTVKAYDGLYHEVLNEPERDQVIKDLIAWLDAH